MGRFYVLSKKILPEQADKIIKEMTQVETVERFEFNEDYSGITVFLSNDDFSTVMDKAVNIISREGSGATLSFDHFVYADGE